MKIRNITYLIGLVAAVLIASCTKEVLVLNEEQEGQKIVSGDPTGMPVMFTVGNLNQTSITRATIPYMADSGRFVCTMYYHSGSSDTDSSYFDIKHPNNHGTLSNAWLMVNDSVGNSVYRKNTFATPTNKDLNDFDKDATNFYWQNRLTHAFLALADYNKLKTNDGDTTSVKIGKLKMYPHYDKDMITLPATGATHDDSVTYANTAADNRYANTYDLTRGTKDSIAEQPDPILALTVMKPAGATPEANRVRLYFKHQFSQIQVNIRGAKDNSTEITASQIDSVELLGVSKEAYVCCRLNAGGTVGKATYQAVNLDSYTDAQLAKNKWGTSFNMFDMATGDLIDKDNNGIDDRYALGFLKSYNAIAYGYLWAIRISWHESAETSEHTHIEHVSTYEVPQNTKDGVALRELQSGIKYIYDLELRRGTLAVIRTQIVDWKQKEQLVYSTDGTITN